VKRNAETKAEKTDFLLRAIAHHIYQHGFQPSIRELAELMGYSSPGYIQILLADITQKGEDSGRMQSRAIEFDWKSYLPEGTLSWDKQPASRRNSKGRVAAKRRGGSR
jgi:SOS-response transcriptional repressor LexA